MQEASCWLLPPPYILGEGGGEKEEEAAEEEILMLRKIKQIHQGDIDGLSPGQPSS